MWKSIITISTLLFGYYQSYAEIRRRGRKEEHGESFYTWNNFTPSLNGTVRPS